MNLKKKAQAVGGLQGFILSIITIAIVLAVSLIILGEMGTTAKELAKTSSNNESISLASSIGALGQSSLFISASGCRNESTQNLLELGVTCNVSNLGNVIVAGNGTVAGGTVYIDYKHFVASAAYNSTNSIITKLATVPTWIGIIIIVSLAFIVLSFFIGKRQ